jgi:tetratricopeptide (TPR) repeat protein
MNHLPGGQVITGDIVPALRVFSNRPEIKWAGRVHNQIQASVAANPRNGETIKLSYVHVTMEHDGYDLYRPEAKEKYTARLDLMKEEIKMHQEEGNNSLEAYYTFQLANGYHMCEMDQEAIETYRQLDYEALENHNKYNAAVIAIAVSIKLDEDKDMDIWMDRLMELAPTQPIVLLHKATVLNKKEEFLEAYPYGAAAIALNRDPNIKRTHMLDEEYCSGLLAELCFKTEMYNEAVMYARRYLDKYPGNPAMRNIDGVSTGVIRDTLLHLYGPDQNLSEVEEDS